MLTVVLYNFTKKNENAALSGFAECSIFIDLREMIMVENQCAAK